MVYPTPPRGPNRPFWGHIWRGPGEDPGILKGGLRGNPALGVVKRGSRIGSKRAYLGSLGPRAQRSVQCALLENDVWRVWVCRYGTKRPDPRHRVILSPYMRPKVVIPTTSIRGTGSRCLSEQRRRDIATVCVWWPGWPGRYRAQAYPAWSCACSLPRPANKHQRHPGSGIQQRPRQPGTRDGLPQRAQGARPNSWRSHNQSQRSEGPKAYPVEPTGLGTIHRARAPRARAYLERRSLFKTWREPPAPRARGPEVQWLTSRSGGSRMICWQ